MAIYLDNAATSYPKPEEVYRGIEAFARASGANPGRGGHRRAVEAEAMINDTRRLLARLFGVNRPEPISSKNGSGSSVQPSGDRCG